jgi:Phytanoyl-CoA dioxygenase (PhyH)
VWTIEQMQTFARDGYMVVRNVIPASVRNRALARIEALLEEQPVEAGHTTHSYWLAADREPELIALVTDTPALALAEALTSPRMIAPTRYLQVALTFPPYRHIPARGHIDGLTPTEPDGRPGTFTMLAGVILSDQTRPMMGNLIVWPGTHRAVAAHLHLQGPDALLESAGYPPIEHGEPMPVLGRVGDVIYAHYLLSHNSGGNTSGVVRRTVYFRLKVDGHDQTWREFVCDELHDLDGVRAVISA